MIFFVLSGKIFFPENMILFLGRKMKDHISQNNTWKWLFKEGPPSN